MNALGMIETNSIPAGIEAGDAMLKAADVSLASAKLAKEMGMMRNCKTQIIPCVMAWEGIVTKHHRRHPRSSEYYRA